MRQGTGESCVRALGAGGLNDWIVLLGDLKKGSFYAFFHFISLFNAVAISGCLV